MCTLTIKKTHTFFLDQSPESVVLVEDTNTDKKTKTNGGHPDPKETGGGNEADKKRNNGPYYVFLAVLISLVLVTFVNVLITYNFFNKYSISDLRSLNLKEFF